jgi:hypothetical protein
MNNAIDGDYLVRAFAVRAFESQIKRAVSAQFPPAAINMSAKCHDQVPSARKWYVPPLSMCHSPTSNWGERIGVGDGVAGMLGGA